MQRRHFEKRPNWVEECRRVGFDFCDLPSQDGSWYWSEGVGYELTLKQVDHLDDATTELHAMCMSAARDIIGSGDYPAQFGLSDTAKALIEQTWKRGDRHLYGRFDLSYDGTDIKMLEYNADTPTSLLEASVVQWDWVMQTKGIPNRDQFNSIHEKLIERWKVVGQSIAMQPRIHFCATKEAGREDWGNLEYLMETATQAGIDSRILKTIPSSGPLSCTPGNGWQIQKQTHTPQICSKQVPAGLSHHGRCSCPTRPFSRSSGRNTRDTPFFCLHFSMMATCQHLENGSVSQSSLARAQT
jgi:glutathionylspermidine synthase